MMHRISFLLGGVLLLSIIDFDWAIKHHRDRDGHRHQDESLLDKQEREREKKDRKKNDDEKTEVNRNLTCYKCDGDLCRDPFRTELAIPLVQCEHSCWKGVFAASVRRSCGNSRCTLTFKGGSALSNTCCQTSFCNNTPMKLPSMMIILSSFLIIIATI